MKQLLIQVTVALMALLTLVACSEDEAINEAVNLSNSITNISITGSDFELDDQSRSMVQISETGVKFLWAENDTVGIFPNKGDQVEFAMENGSGTQTATFSGGGWALKSSASYSAYYPFNFYNRDLKNIPVSFEGQTQISNNNTDHIGAYDYMAASVATPANGSVAFDMKHLGCLVMLKAPGFDKDMQLGKITLKASTDVFTTTGTIDLTAQAPKITAKTTNNTFEINLKKFIIEAKETICVYFIMPPSNLLGQNIEIIFSHQGGEYIKFEVEGKNFEQGKAYALTLTDGIELEQSPVYAIDLGLPSGTLWADRNVGADSPEAYGDYFAWGETEARNNAYNPDNYRWGYEIWTSTVEKFVVTKYYKEDKTYYLNLNDDAAYINMGENWRTPTYQEIKELIKYCTQETTVINGVLGTLFTGPNDNTIFFPWGGYRNLGELIEERECGYYWTNYVAPEYEVSAYALYLKSHYIESIQQIRYQGLTVRAVYRQ